MLPRLILILGDQLTPDISALKGADPERDHVLMAEVQDEATYVRHHKKKLAFVLSAMRHFAGELRALGFKVLYVPLTDDHNTQSLPGEVRRHTAAGHYSDVVMTEAGEWRLRQAFSKLATDIPVPLEIRPDTRFLCSEEEFKDWAEGRKSLRMEYFYREMRRKTGLLMDDGQPIGGQWNFDSENRKPAKNDLFLPSPPSHTPDQITEDVISLVAETFADYPGQLTPFWFAVTRAQAEKAADYFITHALADFGAYQDAMLSGHRFLYHSVLSHYINIGLLDPLSVCWQVDRAYREGRVPLNSAEGFIRQIIGWREYVRGIYFLKMPDYASSNYLEAARALPDFYWSADTDMHCVRAAVTQTMEGAYAHHIQRLMVTGNFALIAGVDPGELHEWYLAVYADAYEWVEMPNTIGMSQFADGGLLGSKPYAASGNYINKMSDYCKSCRYSVSAKTGDDSCPFNSLYWDFMIRHRSRFAKNPRVSRVYTTWDRMKEDTRNAYTSTARAFLARLDAGKRL
ncbi:cryptochrome/photolyase family protein [Kordiimonas sediminis]|nr:cryptochrome/photolyase family protein [Kordiimonas sediminis]